LHTKTLFYWFLYYIVLVCYVANAYDSNYNVCFFTCHKHSISIRFNRTKKFLKIFNWLYKLYLSTIAQTSQTSKALSDNKKYKAHKILRYAYQNIIQVYSFVHLRHVGNQLKSKVRVCWKNKISKLFWKCTFSQYKIKNKKYHKLVQ